MKLFLKKREEWKHSIRDFSKDKNTHGEVETVCTHCHEINLFETGEDFIQKPCDDCGRVGHLMLIKDYDAREESKLAVNKPKKIFVTVSGGVAEVVEGTVPEGYEVEIVDWDNINAGDPFPSQEAADRFGEQ